MSEPQRIHLHYCELSGTSELRLTDTGEFIYYDDHVKEIQRLQAELAEEKAYITKLVEQRENLIKAGIKKDERVGVLEEALTTIYLQSVSIEEMYSIAKKALEDSV